MSDNVIRPKHERVVDFYGDHVPVAQGDGEALYIPLHALTDNLGLNFAAQANRVNRDRVLAAKAQLVEVRGADGRVRPQMCLPLEMIPGWLFGVSTNRVKPELQDRLDLYRAECFTVLWNAFKQDVLPTTPQETSLTPAEQILQQTEALYKLAQQQVELERQYKVMADYTKGFIRDTRGRLITHDGVLADHEQRLAGIELRLDPAANITDAQAAEVALAVKNVAHAMEERGTGGGYGKIYSEMYRRYRISSYKNLAQVKYDEVLAWLGRWYEEVTGVNK